MERRREPVLKTVPPTITIVGKLTPLYVGEVVSVWAFGASWLAKGSDLRRLLLGRRRRGQSSAKPVEAIRLDGG
jgi:hypothetical protein